MACFLLNTVLFVRFAFAFAFASASASAFSFWLIAGIHLDVG